LACWPSTKAPLPGRLPAGHRRPAWPPPARGDAAHPVLLAELTLRRQTVAGLPDPVRDALVKRVRRPPVEGPAIAGQCTPQEHIRLFSNPGHRRWGEQQSPTGSRTAIPSLVDRISDGEAPSPLWATGLVAPAELHWQAMRQLQRLVCRGPVRIRLAAGKPLTAVVFRVEVGRCRRGLVGATRDALVWNACRGRSPLPPYGTRTSSPTSTTAWSASAASRTSNGPTGGVSGAV
jgi:hypothetical protein